MAFSYDPSLKATKDQVRFLVQDTVAASARFVDEEIVWALSTAANIYSCAADLCDQLIARIGGGGGVKAKKIGEFSVQFDVDHYRKLSLSLRSRGYGNQIPYAGGISSADKQVQQHDTDATTPSIMRNLDENQSAPKPSVPNNDPLTTL